MDTKSEVPVLTPGNDHRNAWPLSAEKGKSETTTSKLSTPKNAPSRLERFAREHELEALLQEDESRIGEDVHPVSWISFEDSYISDPLHDCFLVDVLGSKEAVERALEESKIENPLLLVLLECHINRLIDRLGFDLPNFERGENAAWRILTAPTGGPFCIERGCAISVVAMLESGYYSRHVIGYQWRWPWRLPGSQWIRMREQVTTIGSQRISVSRSRSFTDEASMKCCH